MGYVAALTTEKGTYTVPNMSGHPSVRARRNVLWSLPPDQDSSTLHRSSRQPNSPSRTQPHAGLSSLACRKEHDHQLLARLRRSGWLPPLGPCEPCRAKRGVRTRPPQQHRPRSPRTSSLTGAANPPPTRGGCARTSPVTLITATLRQRHQRRLRRLRLGGGLSALAVGARHCS